MRAYPRRDSWRGVRFGRAACRERNLVERTINQRQQHRPIDTRYQTLKETDHAPLTIDSNLLWL